ncbi:N-methylhydantoinase A, beta subunit [Sorangium cellulosum So ce56]|uniref:N-methylhydantoinase A, beta subunit n=1 Tax=Sorangium cellulosum (strain So ce56) TaxID=448385 RepID=A9G759_SORC5|nr:hydantoinase/oxoprolinase family protein [Sorangium cellulosum]CAN92781.1 N-methylhydantoinase A, beta subunit [Sorangium cellulosum So ce56]
MRVASDIGGTFTDLVAFDEDTGELSLAKVPTTPDDLTRGVLETLDPARIEAARIRAFIHGTTLIINALTERKGARTGLLTTRGFRDVLEIGRANRPDIYNFSFRKPEPFVPRDLRLEVTERMDHKGEALTPLDEDGVRRSVRALLDRGARAIAICFLHAYRNPAHERRAAEIARAEAPSTPVSASSEITREWREYERTSTAVLNAYVQPLAAAYLSGLESSLTGLGAAGTSLHVMQSSGGITTFPDARAAPIRLVESGPAGSVLGAIALGQLLGEHDIISLDIGGTTAKCAVLQGGEARVTTEYKVEWTPTSPGYPVMIPVVDIAEIGAGGGSIARIDDAGRLEVGPRSAGAVPGPACYGRGGAEPTTTDANLLCGRINPAYFLGGRIPLDVQAARRAIRRIAAPCGVTEPEAARGILRLANAITESLLRRMTLRRGHDPREFALIAFGGGGSMHASALARGLRIRRVVIPVAPAHFSAWGMLMADMRADIVRTAMVRAQPSQTTALAALLREIEHESSARVCRGGIDPARVSTRRFAELRYAGQEHTVKVPLPAGALDGSALEETIERFHALHEQHYTFRLDAAVEIVSLHVAALGAVDRPRAARLERSPPDPEPARKGARAVDFDELGILQSPLYERARLRPGMHVDGPAVVEEPAASTVLFPGDRLTVHEQGSLLIDIDAPAG